MHNTRGATTYVQRNFQTSFMFHGILVYEGYDTIMGLTINKAKVAIPRKCIKLASGRISEQRSKIFNHSLLQGIVPDKVVLLPTQRIIVPFPLHQPLLKYLKN